MLYRIEITTPEYKQEVEDLITNLCYSVMEKKPDIPDFIVKIHITKAFLEVMNHYDETNELHQEFKKQGVLDPPVEEYVKPQLEDHPQLTVMWDDEPTDIRSIPNILSFSPINASVN